MKINSERVRSGYEKQKFSPQKRKRAGSYLLCEYCKTSFYITPSRARQAQKHNVSTLYCSRSCYGKGKTGKPGAKHTQASIDKMKANPNRPKFKADESNPNFVRFGDDFLYQAPSGGLRKRLFDERGYSCEECGYSKVPAILEIHHKDRNRRNNHKDNLKILCPNCHHIDHFLRLDGKFSLMKKVA